MPAAWLKVKGSQKATDNRQQTTDNSQDDMNIDRSCKGTLLLIEIVLTQGKGDETAGSRSKRAGEQGEHRHQASNDIVDAIVVDTQGIQCDTCREEADKYHHEHTHIQHHRILGYSLLFSEISDMIFCVVFRVN